MKQKRIIILDKNKIELEKHKKSTLPTRIIIFLIVCLLSVTAFLGFKSPIEEKLNPKDFYTTNIIDDLGLTVHFVDVGQGDGIAIRFPDGKTMIIDAGTSNGADDYVNYLKTNFFAPNETKVDYLLLTHSDADHSGGIVKVCDAFDFDTIIRPNIYSKYSKNGVSFDETKNLTGNFTVHNTLTYMNAIKAFNAENANIIFMDINLLNTTHKIQGENYSIDFYYPLKKYISLDEIKEAGASSSYNDYSPIMVLNYLDKKIMLTGDVSFYAEKETMKQVDLPDVDVLKVAHHGSRTSTCMDFLYDITPEYSVISSGIDNDYGHPTDDLLNRLMFVGSNVFRTDTNGDIVCNITTGGQINFHYEDLVLTVNNNFYIRAEYLMFAVILLTAIPCFTIKIRVKD